MKNIKFLSFLLISFVTSAQTNEKFVVHYATTTAWEINDLKKDSELTPQALHYAEQLKNDIQSVEYELRVDETKSEFSMVNKLTAPGKRENYVAAAEKNERFYVDANQYINQKEFQGEEFLVVAPAKGMEWSLKKEKKKIMGFECFKAEYTTTNIEKPFNIVAWYAPK